MPPKRAHDDSSETSHKKQKSQSLLLFEQVTNEADKLLQIISLINPQSVPEWTQTLLDWQVACVLAKSAPYSWTQDAMALLDIRLPSNYISTRSLNTQYETFSKLQKTRLSYFPLPSEFAKDWSQHQNDVSARVLCLRPPEARGLPLCTLHDAFRRFLLAVQGPLPQASDTTTAAVRSAAMLCASMGESFTMGDEDSDNEVQQSSDQSLKENGRSLEFDDCTRGILNGFISQYSLSTLSDIDIHGGVVAGALLEKDTFIALREIKAEPGAAGDAYMQVARGYDLAVQVLQDKKDAVSEAFLKQGAPMFLLCVVGPQLLIAGGFHDGHKAIVEPLGDVYLMLEDYTNARREKLAQVLYALAKGINELKELVNRKPSRELAVFPPFTPRVYTSCMLYLPSGPPTEGHLDFTQKLDFSESSRLLFTARLSSPSLPDPIPVLVKLVRQQYGEDVHRLLATHSLAPVLYAYSCPEGAPRAYVMEYLQPSSWQTLFRYAASSGISSTSESAASIQRSLDKVLDILEKNGKVHGDLRSANIMVNVSQTGELVLLDDGPERRRADLRVVDFDWSGDAGKVCYSPLRNVDIAGITWPGKPGGPIELGHDRSLVHSWYPMSQIA